MKATNPPVLLFETAQGVPMTLVIYRWNEDVITQADHSYRNTAREMVAAFYDRRYCELPFHPEYGQFIADYYMSDLRGHAPTVGLRLQGNVEDRTIDADTMREVVAFLESAR